MGWPWLCLESASVVESECLETLQSYNCPLTPPPPHSAEHSQNEPVISTLVSSSTLHLSRTVADYRAEIATRLSPEPSLSIYPPLVEGGFTHRNALTEYLHYTDFSLIVLEYV